MDNQKLSESEYRFAEIVWEHEPVNSTELTKLCLDRLGWKKSTSYTVLKKLVEKGVLSNKNAIVTALIQREQINRQESEALLYKAFGGSIPDFIAAFLKDRTLTEAEARKIQRMIDESIEEGRK